MTGVALTRRELAHGLAALGGLAAAGPIAAAPGRPAAAELVGRIKARCAREGVPWTEPTVDTFKIGDPRTPVTGLVATFMATLNLMQRAVAAGANFIISHEPVFYNHLDRTDALLADPVYRAKVRFAAEHGLVVWRFHDHFHRLRPEPMATALTAKLGWQRFLDPASSGFDERWRRPPVALRALVAEFSAALPSRSTRVVGDPALTVERIVNVGHTIAGVTDAWSRGDVAIACEVREWESAEYARDAIALGERKALVMIAHERGEEEGMRRCADWLAPLMPEVPVTFIASGEPFRDVPRSTAA